MDRLKIDKRTFYAWGEYRRDAVGLARAKKEAERMRKAGHNARIITRKSGYQVYCDSKIGVMGG
jgi:hypothetical protein